MITPNINKILKLPCNKGYSKYGADMGRPNQILGHAEKLHLQRITPVNGDYDSGGAYWGSPANLWCVFSPENTTNEFPIRVFVRADSRECAKTEVLHLLDSTGFTFFK